MRKTIFRSSAIALVGIGALAGPCLLRAQTADTLAGRAHVVRPGDTLWSLARVYLGDPWRWRELLRLNPTIGGDPTRLEVGDTIVVREHATPSTALTRVEMPNSGVPGDAAPVRAFTSEGSAPAPEPVASVDSAAPPTRTIFFAPAPRPSRVVSDSASSIAARYDSIDAAIARIRLTDYLAAPYMIAAQWPSDPGRLVTTAPPEQLVAGSTVRLSPPRGYEAVVGARFLTYRLGPLVDSARVLIPTGMVSVMASPTAEQTSSARVDAVFDASFPGDGLLPLETVIPTSDWHPTRLVDDVQARVLWASERQNAPDATRVVLLDVGTHAGVQVGDRVLVLRGSEEAERDAHPVAIGMVVRVSKQGASAVIAHGSAEVATGSRARVVPVLP
jgi:hypothetical protein